jgi:hypothetical protein
VRDRATTAEALPGWAHLQQVAYRKLGVTPEWDAEVFARVPRELQDVVRLNLEARRELHQLVTTVHDTGAGVADHRSSPSRRADLGIPGGRGRVRVPWEYLAAVNLVESAMGRIRGTSDAGAHGPMRFLHATWAAYGEGDIHDPHDAIRAAARYARRIRGLLRLGDADDSSTFFFFFFAVVPFLGRRHRRRHRGAPRCGP